MTTDPFRKAHRMMSPDRGSDPGPQRHPGCGRIRWSEIQTLQEPMKPTFCRRNDDAGGPHCRRSDRDADYLCQVSNTAGASGMTGMLERVMTGMARMLDLNHLWSMKLDLFLGMHPSPIRPRVTDRSLYWFRSVRISSHTEALSQCAPVNDRRLISIGFLPAEGCAES